MAIKKHLLGRIIHKHDIEENWDKATGFIPQQGEIIVYDIDDNYEYERFKIGDGKTTVINLPFQKTNINDLKAVSYDVAQELTEEQKAQAKLNIGVKDTPPEVIISDVEPADENIKIWVNTNEDDSNGDVSLTDEITNLVSSLVSSHDSDNDAHIDIRDSIPKNVSQLNNDSGYLTEHQSLAGLATESYVNSKIASIPTPDVSGQINTHNTSTSAHADIRNAIPTTLSDLTDDSTHRTVTDAEKTAWNAKSTFSGNYNDLTNKPSIPSAVTVDSALSYTSTNPVQNKIITQELNEVKTSVSEGKALVAAAVTDKGVSTAADATFATLETNVRKITTLSEGTADANATSADIASGKTAYVKGAKVTGNAIVPKAVAYGAISPHSRNALLSGSWKNKTTVSGTTKTWYYEDIPVALKGSSASNLYVLFGSQYDGANGTNGAFTAKGYNDVIYAKWGIGSQVKVTASFNELKSAGKIPILWCDGDVKYASTWKMRYTILEV